MYCSACKETKDNTHFSYSQQRKRTRKCKACVEPPPRKTYSEPWAKNTVPPAWHAQSQKSPADAALFTTRTRKFLEEQRAAGLLDQEDAPGTQLFTLGEQVCHGCGRVKQNSEMLCFHNNILCAPCQQRFEQLGIPKSISRENMAKLQSAALAEHLYGNAKTIGDFQMGHLAVRLAGGPQGVVEHLSREWAAKVKD